MSLFYSFIFLFGNYFCDINFLWLFLKYFSKNSWKAQKLYLWPRRISIPLAKVLMTGRYPLTMRPCPPGSNSSCICLGMLKQTIKKQWFNWKRKNVKKPGPNTLQRWCQHRQQTILPCGTSTIEAHCVQSSNLNSGFLENTIEKAWDIDMSASCSSLTLLICICERRI